MTPARADAGISAALRRFQAVLDRLGPQADEGDLHEMTAELQDWAGTRSAATRRLMDGT